jgi:hypothetical protein
MNDTINRQLQQIVESALGSVRASADRKSAIREELLSHVTAVFTEELAQRGNERAALAAARQRFGAPEDVSTELQESVPLTERWFLISDKELLMSSKFWLAAIFAIATGPAIILPAMAKLRDENVFQAFPFILGGAILLAGLVAAGYGIARHFTRHA